MDVQSISSNGISSSEILRTQKQSSASDTKALTTRSREYASQDTYVPEDTSTKESAGIYELVSDSKGTQTISFEAPTQSGSAAQMGSAAVQQVSSGSSSSSTTSTTDDLEDELEDLEEQKSKLQKQLQGTSDEQATAKLKKQINQLDTQIQAKEAEVYASESESDD